VAYIGAATTFKSLGVRVRTFRRPARTAYLLPWWRATLGARALTLLLRTSLHPQLILLKLLFLVIV
jgi:hypothetical protein